MYIALCGFPPFVSRNRDDVRKDNKVENFIMRCTTHKPIYIYIYILKTSYFSLELVFGFWARSAWCFESDLVDFVCREEVWPVGIIQVN